MRVAILSSVAITPTVVCTVVLLVTKGDPLFPRLMLDEVRLSALWFYAAGSAALLSILALIVLWVRRRSLLDLRLMVVMCAYVITQALAVRHRPEPTLRPLRQGGRRVSPVVVRGRLIKYSKVHGPGHGQMPRV